MKPTFFKKIKSFFLRSYSASFCASPKRGRSCEPRNKLTPQDILSMEEYGQRRREIREALSPFKTQRRMSLGPSATVMFEHYDILKYQVHEMLYVEKAGEEQVQEEIDAYAPLMPGPGRLTFTLMFEVEDPQERLIFLRRLTGVEETLSLQWENHSLPATPVDAQERTREGDGKTSAVHFMKIDIPENLREDFRRQGGPVTLAVTHQHYTHRSLLPHPLVTMLQREV